MDKTQAERIQSVNELQHALDQLGLQPTFTVYELMDAVQDAIDDWMSARKAEGADKDFKAALVAAGVVAR